MTDARALAIEYLKQQRLLGGDSVILAEARSTEQGAVSPSAALVSPPSSAPSSVLPAPGLSFDPPSSDLFAVDPIQQTQSLTEVAQLIAGCRKCKLCDGRTNTVPGEGPANARLVVIDSVVLAGNEPQGSKWLDLLMLVLLSGRERTEQQWRALLDASGFEIQHIEDGLIQARCL